VLPLKINVYVDGFNLYYGALRRTPYKWLDLGRLCSLILPNDKVNRIRYFTARVSSYTHDPDAPTRQDVYLQALATIPSITIHFGHFLASTVRMQLAHPLQGAPRTVEVKKTEEKGSDVNLATYLLRDAFLRDFEGAVLITNDSDLLEPIKIIRAELNLHVGLLNPHPRPSRVLMKYASFVKQIRAGLLARCQFDDPITLANGSMLHKPASW
jgi:hypothetical protein